jgi:hypothetical protein
MEKVNDPMDVASEVEFLFSPDSYGNISAGQLQQLLKLGWAGSLFGSSGSSRAMCWRVLLDLLSSNNVNKWKDQLKEANDSFHTTKSTVMPSLDKVSADPLSAQANDEWNIYYKNVDLINFINTDLDRLYITGIPDEYFESKERREMLLAILLIWSFKHPVISYRQGMHEIAAYFMFCVEQELAGWDLVRNNSSSSKSPLTLDLLDCFSEKTVEAYTYQLFFRVMSELEPLYDPVSYTPRGVENQPFIVQFCTKVQGICFILSPSFCTLQLLYLTHFLRLYFRALFTELRLGVMCAFGGYGNLCPDLRPAVGAATTGA